METKVNEFDQLPNDVIISLALMMDLPEIINFCRSSKRFNRVVCDNYVFWMNKLNKEYPFINISIIRKEYYKKLYEHIKTTEIAADKVPDPDGISFTPIVLNYDFRNFLRESGLFEYAPLAVTLAVDQGISNRYILFSLFHLYVKLNNMKDNEGYLRSTPLMDKYLGTTYQTIQNTNRDRGRPIFNPEKFRYSVFQSIIGQNTTQGNITDPSILRKLKIANIELKNVGLITREIPGYEINNFKIFKLK